MAEAKHSEAEEPRSTAKLEGELESEHVIDAASPESSSVSMEISLNPSDQLFAPIISGDGNWWWDGKQWQAGPAPAARGHKRRITDEDEDEDYTSGYFPARSFLRSHRPETPISGVRNLLYQISGGAIRLPPSQRDQQHHKLKELARVPVESPPARVAFVSSKGGVGKTTTCLLTSSQLGLLRHDRIITVEANPHHGTFRSRVQMNHERSLHHLLS
ncbi:MAG: hypothetical protein ACREN8_04105, partial [Candidatus Dormibacteraceae bacterium]